MSESQSTKQAGSKGLWAKIAAVQAKTQAVEKTGHVQFGRTQFDHFQEHGLLDQLKPLLEAEGLAVVCGSDGYHRDGNSTILDFHLTVVDVETGEAHTEAFPNEGVDQGDKGFNKAYTGALKYALQKFFLIPTAKVEEQEGSDNGHNEKSTRSNPVVQRPSGRAAEKTEKAATAKQRGLINGKAGEAELPSLRLLNILREASGVHPIELEPHDAKAAAQRILDRLPARLVDPVLEGIEAAAKDAKVEF